MAVNLVAKLQISGLKLSDINKQLVTPINAALKNLVAKIDIDIKDSRNLTVLNKKLETTASLLERIAAAGGGASAVLATIGKTPVATPTVVASPTTAVQDISNLVLSITDKNKKALIKTITEKLTESGRISQTDFKNLLAAGGPTEGLASVFVAGQRRRKIGIGSEIEAEVEAKKLQKEESQITKKKVRADKTVLSSTELLIKNIEQYRDGLRNLTKLQAKAIQEAGFGGLLEEARRARLARRSTQRRVPREERQRNLVDVQGESLVQKFRDTGKLTPREFRVLNELGRITTRFVKKEDPNFINRRELVQTRNPKTGLPGNFINVRNLQSIEEITKLLKEEAIISRSRKKFARKMLSEYERAGKILEDLNAGILPTIKQFKLLEKLDLVDRIDPIKLSSPVDPNKAREKVLDRLRSGRRIDQTNFPLIIEAARRGEIDPTGLSSRIVPGTGVRNTTIGFAKQSQTIDPDELTRKQILKRQIAADKRLLAVTTRAIDIAEQANTDRIISNKKFQFLQRQGRTDLLNPDVQIGSTRRPANTNPQFATSNVILPTAGNAPRPQGFIPFNSFNQSAQKFLKTQQQINTGMKDFGDQAFLAGRRFLAFTAATSSIFAFSFALQRALADSVQFEREMIRVAQVTGTSIDSTRNFGRQIRQLSIDLGISGTELSNVAVTLAQAGFKDNDLQAALNTIAKTDLTATFESLEQTTEGLIAAKNQFKLLAQDYEGAIGSVNAVSAKFAVESGDLITAIQKTGGAFKAATPETKSGKEALQELLGVFTTIRQTTRESADTIATGLRTIISRMQDAKIQSTIEKALQINLRDAEGQFVGIQEAIVRIGEALNGIPKTDPLFAKVAQELGGQRQISKVTPLLTEFREIQKIIDEARVGEFSVDIEAQKGVQGLARQFQSLTNTITKFTDAVANDEGVRNLVVLFSNLTSVAASLSNVVVPLIPALTLLGGVGIAKLSARTFTSIVGSHVGKRELLLGAGAIGAVSAGSFIGNQTRTSSGVSNALSLGATGAIAGAPLGLPGIAIGGFTGAIAGAVQGLNEFEDSLKRQKLDDLVAKIQVADSSKDRTDFIKFSVDAASEAVRQSRDLLEPSNTFLEALKTGAARLISPLTLGENVRTGQRFGGFLPTTEDINADVANLEKSARNRVIREFGDILPFAQAARKDIEERFKRGEISLAQAQELEQPILDFIRTLTGRADIVSSSLSNLSKEIQNTQRLVAQFADLGRFVESLKDFNRIVDSIDDSLKGFENQLIGFGGGGNLALTEPARRKIQRETNPRLLQLADQATILRSRFPTILRNAAQAAGDRSNNVVFQRVLESELQKAKIGKELASKIAINIDEDALVDIFANVNRDLSEISDKTLDDILSPIEKSVENGASKIDEQFNEFVRLLDENNQKLQQIVTLRQAAGVARENVVDIRTGRSDLASALARRRVIQGNLGFAGQTPLQIFNRLQDLRAGQRQAIDRQNLGVPGATTEVKKFQLAISRAEEALANLAESTDIVNALERKRGALQDDFLNFIQKTPEEQDRAIRARFAALDLLQRGGKLTDVADQRLRGDLVSELISAHDVVFGNGMTGGQILQRISENTFPELKKLRQQQEAAARQNADASELRVRDAEKQQAGFQAAITNFGNYTTIFARAVERFNDRVGLNQPPQQFAVGGRVPGVGNTDSVSARLMPGEYVVQKNVVQSLGVDFFDKLNKGDLVQHFASGGVVRSRVELLREVKRLLGVRRLKDLVPGGIQFDVPFSSKVRGTFTPKSRMIRLGPNAGIATALEELIHSADFAIGKGRFSSLDPKSGFGEFTERALRDKRNIKFLKGLRETGATTKRYEVFAKLAKGIITGSHQNDELAKEFFTNVLPRIRELSPPKPTQINPQAIGIIDDVLSNPAVKPTSTADLSVEFGKTKLSPRTFTELTRPKRPNQVSSLASPSKNNVRLTSARPGVGSLPSIIDDIEKSVERVSTKTTEPRKSIFERFRKPATQADPNAIFKQIASGSVPDESGILKRTVKAGTSPVRAARSAIQPLVRVANAATLGKLDIPINQVPKETVRGAISGVRKTASAVGQTPSAIRKTTKTGISLAQQAIQKIDDSAITQKFEPISESPVLKGIKRVVPTVGSAIKRFGESKVGQGLGKGVRVLGVAGTALEGVSALNDLSQDKHVSAFGRGAFLSLDLALPLAGTAGNVLGNTLFNASTLVTGQRPVSFTGNNVFGGLQEALDITKTEAERSKLIDEEFKKTKFYQTLGGSSNLAIANRSRQAQGLPIFESEEQLIKEGERIQSEIDKKLAADLKLQSIASRKSQIEFDLSTARKAVEAFGAGAGRHSLGTVFGFSSEDEAIKRIFELEEELRRTRFATGGLVPGAGNMDSVRASLMPGEYVVRKSVVEQLGVGFFDRLNKGFASGGLVQQQTSAPSIGGFPEFRDSANMFANAMAMFDNTATKLARSMEMIPDSIELKVADFNVNVNGIQGMEDIFRDFLRNEITTAIQNFQKKFLKGSGPPAPKNALFG